MGEPKLTLPIIIIIYPCMCLIVAARTKIYWSNFQYLCDRIKVEKESAWEQG